MAKTKWNADHNATSYLSTVVPATRTGYSYAKDLCQREGTSFVPAPSSCPIVTGAWASRQRLLCAGLLQLLLLLGGDRGVLRGAGEHTGAHGEEERRGAEAGLAGSELAPAAARLGHTESRSLQWGRYQHPI